MPRTWMSSKVMAWVLPALLPAVFAGGCDSEEVAAQARKIEALEQQERGMAKAVEELRAEIAGARSESAALSVKLDRAKSDTADGLARVATLESTLEALDSEVDALQRPAAPTVAPTAPTVRAGRPDPAERYRVEVGDSAVRGRDDAKVTVVLFSDFQCPYCKRVQTTVTEIERAYGDDVRIVAKHNPLAFHNRALPAALASEAAAQQGRFWEMAALLYANQRDLSEANFEEWAADVGCKLGRFKKDISDSAIRRRIRADQDLASKVGARGTPAFFVNGRYLAGAQPFDAFKRLIDEEIENVDARIAKGVARKDVYEAIMADAKPEV